VSEVVRLTLRIPTPMTDAMGGPDMSHRPSRSIRSAHPYQGRRVGFGPFLGVTGRGYCGPEKRARQGRPKLPACTASIRQTAHGGIWMGRWCVGMLVGRGGCGPRFSDRLTDPPNGGNERWRVGSSGS